MKKYVYALMVALFASVSFVLTSCSDDKDEPSTGEGKVTVAYENAITETLGVVEASYQNLSLNGGKLTFRAVLGDMGDVSFLQFTTSENSENLSKGQKLELRALQFISGQSSDATYFTDNYSGTATVKSIGNNTITLKLDNLKFNRRYDGANGSKEQAMTFNGTITYTNED